MKYEYTYIDQWETEADDRFLARVNELGSQGWRFISTTYWDTGTGCRVFMERTVHTPDADDLPRPVYSTESKS